MKIDSRGKFYQTEERKGKIIVNSPSVDNHPKILNEYLNFGSKSSNKN